MFFLYAKISCFQVKTVLVFYWYLIYNKLKRLLHNNQQFSGRSTGSQKKGTFEECQKNSTERRSVQAFFAVYHFTV